MNTMQSTSDEGGLLGRAGFDNGGPPSGSGSELEDVTGYPVGRIIERSPHAMVLLVGESHVIRDVNPAFCDLMRVRKSDVVGQEYASVFGEPSGDGPLSLLDRAVMFGEASVNREITRARVDEPDEVWSYTVWPIDAAAGKPGGVVMEICDRTDAVSARRQLEEMADQIRVINDRLLRSAVQEKEWAEKAELASRAKSDFLSMMSHEFRTPLTGIVGHTEVLEVEAMGPINDQQRDSLSRIKHCSAELLKMIDDVLGFARSQSEADQVSLERVDVRQLAREAAALIEPLAERKGLDLHVRVPDQPISAETDAGKVRQILMNLLANAVKFTDSGEVRLEVSAEVDAVNFVVSDTGIGIEDGDLARVFEPFVQAEQVTTRRFGGTGLGLPISRALATRLGGEVAVRSEPGRGSTFSVHLPAVTPARAPAVGGPS